MTDGAHLARTLQRLLPQAVELPAEVLVVSRLGAALAPFVEPFAPWVRVITADPATPIPQMRAIGLEQARAPVTAIIEDHVLVPPGWARRLTEMVEREGAVCAGPVSSAANARLAHRAAFLCEYSALLPPVRTGEVSWLPGNNTGYPTRALRDVAFLMQAGAWEDKVHDELRRRGQRLLMSADVEAGHALEVSVADYVGLRYHYSRAFAGSRTRGASFARRIVYSLGCTVLPVVLLGRIVSRAVTRAGYRATAAISLPLLVLFVLAWAVGEAVGSLAGPGESLTKVR